LAEDSAIAAGRGSIHISFRNITTLGLGAIFFLIYARALTVPQLGIVATINLIVTFFQYLGLIGLANSSPSLIASALVEGRDKARRITSCILLLSLGFATISMIAVYLLSHTLATGLHFSAPELVFQIAAAEVFTNILAFCFDGVTQGMRRFVVMAYSSITGQVARIIVSLILIVKGYPLVGMILGGALGPLGFFSAIVEFPIIMKHLPFSLPSISDLSQVVKTSTPLYGVSLLTSLSTQIDLAIVVATTNISATAVYSVVQTISQIASAGIITPLNTSLLPQLAKIRKEGKSLTGAFKEAARFIAIITIPAAFALGSSTPLIVHLLAGPKYLPAATPLIFIMVSVVPSGFMVLSSACLQASERNNEIFVATATGVMVEGIIGLLLTPLFGPTGAAISRLGLSVVAVLVCGFYVRRIIRLRIQRPRIMRITLASLAFLLIPVVSSYYHGYVPAEIMSAIAALGLFALVVKTTGLLRSRDVAVMLGSLPMALQRLTRTRLVQTVAYWFVKGDS
jgi:O-antigen/teichoic acid export membrane protein